MEKLEKEWTQYPVLHFDLSIGKHMDADALTRYLLFILANNEKKFAYEGTEQDPNIRMARLIEAAYEKTGTQVVVLIDEYDAPLLDVAHEDEKLDTLRNIMRNFYSPLKAYDPHLRFVFLTGITKFSQLSIFSELNNIKNISMMPEYAGICGITKEELLTTMDPDIDRLATVMKKTKEEIIQALQDNYDGYHFCWPSSDIFNPFSLLNCIADCRFDSYWFGSGTPTYLIEMMRKFKQLPSQIGGNRAKASSFDAPTQNMRSMLPLLYQSGYLTIKAYDVDIDMYTLDIPNKEIKVGLFESLLPNYVEEETDNAKVLAADLSRLIKKQDMNDALQLLQTFLATVPYCDNTLYEGHYQQMLYVIFTLLTDYRIGVEQRTLKGRTDMTLETDDHIYVMEIKFGHTAQEALDQINACRYAEAYALKGKAVTKVGIAFHVQEERNITDWIIE